MNTVVVVLITWLTLSLLVSLFLARFITVSETAEEAGRADTGFEPAVEHSRQPALAL